MSQGQSLSEKQPGATERAWPPPAHWDHRMQMVNLLIPVPSRCVVPHLPARPQATAEFHVPGETCAVTDFRPWPPGPCHLSNLFHTPPCPRSSLAQLCFGGEMGSVPCPGFGWQSSDVGGSLPAALLREGFLQAPVGGVRFCGLECQALVLVSGSV